jgi:hypothetical protein
MTAQPTNVGHQIGDVPGIEGYRASSWLQFLVPPPSDPHAPGSLAKSLGTVKIPLVIRAYPDSPTMALQSGLASYPQTGAIDQAAQWNYAFTYALPVHYPQDVVAGTVTFNVAPRVAADEPFVDVFEWLAQFVTAFGQVQTDLAGSLATVTPETTGKQLQIASAAIQSVNLMLAKITGRAVKAGLAMEPQRLKVAPPQRRFGSATRTVYTFTLGEMEFRNVVLPHPPAAAARRAHHRGGGDGPEPDARDRHRWLYGANRSPGHVHGGKSRIVFLVYRSGDG